MKDKQRLYIQIYNTISDLIKSGEFPVGLKLPTERDLADRFNVSRPTIREAIIALEAKEMVTIKASSGVYVLDSDLSNDGFSNDISAFELLEARVILESESAALAARMISSDQLKSLDKALSKLRSEKGSSSKADREFHTIIALGTHNKILLRQINQLWDLQDNLNHINKTRESVCVDEDIHSKIADHEAIYEAIKNNNPTQARKAMQLHFTDLLDAMHEVTEKMVVDEAKNKAMSMRKRFSIE